MAQLAATTAPGRVHAALAEAGAALERGASGDAEVPESLCAPGEAQEELPVVRIPKRFDLRGSEWLTHLLPDCEVVVEGSLVLSRCTTLVGLPEALTVNGDLALRKCSALKRLPKRLRVTGCINLTNCTALEALPDGIDVGEDIYLRGCSSLKTLPDGMQVRRKLNMQRCTSLTTLPDGLAVPENINFTGCTALERLPRMSADGNVKLSLCRLLTTVSITRVSGDLKLRECDALTSLGPELRVDGDLDLFGCSALQELPAGLVVGCDLELRGTGVTRLERLDVGGKLDLRGSTLLTEIGEGVHIGGNLHLRGCSELAGEIPADCKVGGGMDLDNCRKLRKLPRELTLNGMLDLEDCVELRELPEVLSVGGYLQLRGSGVTKLPKDLYVGTYIVMPNNPVRELPAGMRIMEGLYLDACTNLRSFPDDMQVGGELYLRENYNLTCLPSNMKRVEGDLDLYDCISLTELPEGLYVEGDLDLTNCTSLTALPRGLHVEGSLTACFTPLTALCEGLFVGENLDLTRCILLRELPSDMTVNDTICLENCRALSSLPSAMLEWPEGDGGRRDVYLAGSGLSEETLEWLRESDTPGLRFHVDRVMDDESGMRPRAPAFATIEEATLFWADSAGESGEAEGGAASESSRALAKALDVPAPSQIILLTFLDRLRGAKEFGVSESRRALASRVLEVLETLHEDPFSRDELLRRMADSLDRCDDKPVWALNQMCLVTAVAKARGDRRKLRALGCRVMRLMVVHEHAVRKIRSLQWVDDVCVYLRFEIDLRETLDLPVQATSMIFPSYIKISEAELEAAKEAALAITDDQFEAWLAEWPEWQRQQRAELAQELCWSKLPIVKRRRTSLLRRSLRNLFGDRMTDPVQVGGRGATFSLEELLRHWVATGMDLNNTPRSLETMRSLERIA